MTKKTNILYFEGAGMDFNKEEMKFSDVGNFRIRTAFRNLECKLIYIEMGRCSRHITRTLTTGRTKTEIVSEWALHIMHLFEITGDNDDCNKNSIPFDYDKVREFDYSKEGITQFINTHLNCNFETIEVLNDFYGYRVHADNRGYNISNDFPVNHELAEKRKLAYEKVDEEYRTALNEKYSKISLMEMNDESITIRCYASDQVIKKVDLPRIKTIQL